MFNCLRDGLFLPLNSLHIIKKMIFLLLEISPHYQKADVAASLTNGCLYHGITLKDGITRYVEMQ
jgi:Tfp pilus assembly protein PilZ